ncbi:hypothetical protein M9N92_002272 [Escherichia coli]|nr:hypothetical protein [Escherichia coli]EJF8323013.1 hypothetical protein [Escherichia coli]EJN8032096.1 hypothetical protein [Escherichia coli]
MKHPESIIYIAGYSVYEVAGVGGILRDAGIRFSFVGTETCLSKSDILILCFSDVPLLGWWRWERLSSWLQRRYDCLVILLYPPRLSVKYCLKAAHICYVNSEHLPGILSCIRGLRVREKRMTDKSGIMETRRILLNDSLKSEIDRSDGTKNFYRKRASLLAKLGFSDLHSFRVFMAGFFY